MLNFKRKYALVPAAGCMSCLTAIPAFASDSGVSSASLADTLKTFSDVFAWFLKEGANLLGWMLDKPIILLSLAIFFVGSVVGMLSRIYSSF